MAALAYCNVTTHLTNEVPTIEMCQQKRVVEGWVLASDQTKTYQHYATGQVNQVFADGVKLTAKTSIATVEATASTWWYDPATDIVYIQNSAGTDPDSSNVIEVGEDWATFKATMRNNAMEFMNSILCRVYNVPLIPRSIQSHTTDDYDYIIVRACALLTCALIMLRKNPADPAGEKLYRNVWNPDKETGEPKGLLNQLLDGDVILTDQMSSKRVGGWIIVPQAANTITRGPIITGEYTGWMQKRYRIQIDTSGAPGIATYKVSYDGAGTVWDLTLQPTYHGADDEYRFLIADNLHIFWPPGVSQVSGEYWDLYLYPQSDDVVTSKIGSIEAVR